MKRRHQRLLVVLFGLGALGSASALVLKAFGSNMVFFYSPTQVAARAAPADRAFRIGGLVQPASVARDGGSLQMRFVITDEVNHVPVVYTGLLPDLFREGKGVVAQGRIGADGVFVAEQVLAKHYENYMPPEAAAALKEARPQ